MRPTLSILPLVVPAILCFVFSAMADPPPDAPSSPPLTHAEQLQELLRLDPASDGVLSRLANQAADLAESARAADVQFKAQRKQIREGIALRDLPAPDLPLYFQDPPGSLAGREIRGLDQVTRLAQDALIAASDPQHDAAVRDLQEVLVALRNNRRSPVPNTLGVASSWKFLFRAWGRSIGKGTTPATNLASSATPDADLSRLDPIASTFWTRPPGIADQDLFAGFGRDRLPRPFAGALCEYDGPKTSAGTRAGFDVKCEGREYQVKFGEVSSEPFTARIFHALGYYVDPTDYSPGLRIRYDRRLLREFHQRAPLTMRIRPHGVPLGTVQLQPRYDPFRFVVEAVFKDGRTATGAELKRMLFQNPDLPAPEDSPDNFRADVEATLNYLVLAPVNVQPKDLPTESIGCWDFAGLGHEELRELRGAGLLAAWLGWFDSRHDNTRLRIAPSHGGVVLRHFFTDLGAGLGGGTGWFSPHGEDPNLFDWAFTRPEIVRGPGRMTTPFQVVHYHAIVRTPAFREMTIDDARWMARLIAQLRREQLRAALIAAGYTATEVKLYEEKLVSRRDRMILDLQLQDEIPLLEPGGVNRFFSYDPAADGPIQATLPSGETVTATASDQVVHVGNLCERPE